jgi:voltage-gated potassium channel
MRWRSVCFCASPPDRADLPLVVYLGGILYLLVAHRRAFARHGLVSAALFAVAVFVSFFIWATLGVLRLGDHFHPPVHDLTTALYLTIVTVSSVGFGDIVAQGQEARLFSGEVRGGNICWNRSCWASP